MPTVYILKIRHDSNMLQAKIQMERVLGLPDQPYAEIVKALNIGIPFETQDVDPETAEKLQDELSCFLTELRGMPLSEPYNTLKLQAEAHRKAREDLKQLSETLAQAGTTVGGLHPSECAQWAKRVADATKILSEYVGPIG
jgi:hypothetical protein